MSSDLSMGQVRVLGISKGAQTSDILYVLKAMAIVMSVAAHCHGYTLDVPRRLSSLLGTLGVPLFFFLSGLFFRGHEKGFWAKKLKTLIIPWCTWGIITFAISLVLGSNPMTFVEFLKWMLGTDSWLYFVPALLACFALFCVSVSEYWTYFLIVVSLISNALTIVGVMDGITWLTAYQNVFSWVGYFAVGKLIGARRAQKMFFLLVCWRYVIYALSAILSIAYIYVCEPSYWTAFSIPSQFICGAALLCIAAKFHQNALLIDIGKNTYPIFFVHMQVGIGSLNILFLKRMIPVLGYGEYFLVLLWPVLVVLISYGMIKFGSFVARQIGFGRWLWLLGIENRDISVAKKWRCRENDG